MKVATVVQDKDLILFWMVKKKLCHMLINFTASISWNMELESSKRSMKFYISETDGTVKGELKEWCKESVWSPLCSGREEWEACEKAYPSQHTFSHLCSEGRYTFCTRAEITHLPWIQHSSSQCRAYTPDRAATLTSALWCTLPNTWATNYAAQVFLPHNSSTDELLEKELQTVQPCPYFFWQQQSSMLPSGSTVRRTPCTQGSANFMLNAAPQLWLAHSASLHGNCSVYNSLAAAL